MVCRREGKEEWTQTIEGRVEGAGTGAASWPCLACGRGSSSTTDHIGKAGGAIEAHWNIAGRRKGAGAYTWTT